MNALFLHHVQGFTVRPLGHPPRMWESEAMTRRRKSSAGSEMPIFDSRLCLTSGNFNLLAMASTAPSGELQV